MIPGDFDRYGSWGISTIDGKIKLLDYGLNDQIYDTYYSRKL